MTVVDARLELATQWMKQQIPGITRVYPLAGDASFRRYFRVWRGERSWVLMDAPPDKENLEPFLSVRHWMEDAGLRVPKLVAENLRSGFLILNDFGDETLSLALKQGKALKPLVADALRQLHRLQEASVPETIPDFDKGRMHRESDLFLDWYVPNVANLKVDTELHDCFHTTLDPWFDQIASLPQVAVHLDYHSRNLMLPKSGIPLGVIDFQDAVVGPVTYDLASLLYDCYQDYPEVERQYWSRRFFNELPEQLRVGFENHKHWHRMVRLTAFQRHIKAIGIFARLAYRDGKRQFLNEIPLTLKHLGDEMDALDIPDLPELIKRQS